MKNIDTAFKQVRLFSLAVIIVCLTLTLFISYKSYQLATGSQQKILVKPWKHIPLTGKIMYRWKPGIM